MSELYVVVGDNKDDSLDRCYWTGHTEGRWPIYLKDRARACETSRAAAVSFAAQFNALRSHYDWRAVPASEIP